MKHRATYASRKSTYRNVTSVCKTAELSAWYLAREAASRHTCTASGKLPHVNLAGFQDAETESGRPGTCVALLALQYHCCFIKLQPHSVLTTHSCPFLRPPKSILPADCEAFGASATCLNCTARRGRNFR